MKTSIHSRFLFYIFLSYSLLISCTSSTDSGKKKSKVDSTKVKADSTVEFTEAKVDSTGEFITVKLGKQIWMVENLNMSRFKNGDLIPEVKSNEEWLKYSKERKPASCYYNNDPSKGKMYGKLYNWYAVSDPRGLAPEGWHIPTEDEWKVLVDYLGGESLSARKMAATEGWDNNDNGTNESHFNAVPIGIRGDSGLFGSTGESTTWWCNTEKDENWAKNRGIAGLNMMRGQISKGFGFAVRCVKD